MNKSYLNTILAALFLYLNQPTLLMKIYSRKTMFYKVLKDFKSFETKPRDQNNERLGQGH